MVTVETWSVFRRGPEGGNPCPVVVDAGRLRPAQMQAIAAHYGHESAFVVGVGPASVWLRYFVPAHEMRMCVHATVAAVTALLGSRADRGGDTIVHTPSGEHRVTWGDGDPPEVTVEQHRPSFGQAVRTGRDELDLDAVTRGRDLTEPELR